MPFNLVCHAGFFLHSPLELLEKRVSKRFIVKFVLDVNSVIVVALQHRSVSVTHFPMIPNHPRGVFFL